MMKYTIGFLLKKIIDDTKTKINAHTKDSKKLYLYSAHDYNIGFFLRAFDLLSRPRNPKYGSYIVMELHKLEDNYSFKVR